MTSTEQLQVIQDVVQRVGAYQDGAPEGTVLAELKRGLSEAGVDLPEDDVQKLASAIESEEGIVDASSVLS